MGQGMGGRGVVKRVIEVEEDVDEKTCGRHCLIEVRFMILASLLWLLYWLPSTPPAVHARCPRTDDLVVSPGLGGWLPFDQAHASSLSTLDLSFSYPALP